ncbi:MAG TPA: hypothetical protein VFV67_12255 [Actinophytocola sp.]|nr:hypothetical protein [Actinophytocola sp.]HEU5471418.1 hypothetical protein [Actinophytocola sp.]
MRTKFGTAWLSRSVVRTSTSRYPAGAWLPASVSLRWPASVSSKESSRQSVFGRSGRCRITAYCPVRTSGSAAVGRPEFSIRLPGWGSGRVSRGTAPGWATGAPVSERSNTPVPSSVANTDSSTTSTAAASTVAVRRDRVAAGSAGSAGALAGPRGPDGSRACGAARDVPAMSVSPTGSTTVCAPSATTSSGVSSSSTGTGSRARNSRASNGIRLEPPTRCTAVRSVPDSPAERTAPASNSTARSSSGPIVASNSALVSNASGSPPGSATSTCCCCDSSSLARRTSSRSRDTSGSSASATGRVRSASSSRSPSTGRARRRCSIIRWSRSSPPRSGSPAQSTTVSPVGSRRTTAASQVPAPKSSTASVAPTGMSCRPAKKAAAPTGSGTVDSRGTRPCAALISAPSRVEPQSAGWVSTRCCTGAPAVRIASASAVTSTARTSVVVGTTESPSSTSGSPIRALGLRSSRAGSRLALRSASAPTTGWPSRAQNTAEGNHGAPAGRTSRAGRSGPDTTTTVWEVPKSTTAVTCRTAPSAVSPFRWTYCATARPGRAFRADRSCSGWT